MTIQVSFKLKQFQPDQRRFQTVKTLFEPVQDFIVIVDVPLIHEYIYNVETIIQQQLIGDKGDMPIWTPKGLAYIEEQLLSRIDKDQPENSDDIEWEN